MAITGSSKATTLTRLPSCRAVLGALVVALSPAQAAAPAMTTSFFDPFDALDTKRWYVSNGWANGAHQGCTWSRDALKVASGALTLRLYKAADKLRSHRCAELRTHARLGYGWYEARIKTAAGSGLNTAMFTYSGQPLTKVHDEIDFEFLGKDPTGVQMNYYTNAKGGHESRGAVGGAASAGFNHYAFDWSPGRIRWFINGRLVRTADGAALPTTSGQFFLSLWNAGPSVYNWLGRFDPGAPPVNAQIDWIAYTRAGERCRFAASQSCRS